MDYSRKVLDAYAANPNKSAQTTIIKIIANGDFFSSERQRVAETNSWIVAGQDTTAMTLANTLTLLAKHPEEQQKVRDALLADPSTNAKDIPAFANMTKEAMRVLSVAANGSLRETGREFLLDNGTVIPKGAACQLNQFVGFRNPDVFRNPTDFDPSRWDNPTPAMQAALLPFAIGNRNCPGQYLARAEIESLLPRILTQYSIELVEEGTMDYFLTLKFKGTRLRARTYVAT